MDSGLKHFPNLFSHNWGVFFPGDCWVIWGKKEGFMAFLLGRVLSSLMWCPAGVQLWFVWYRKTGHVPCRCSAVLKKAHQRLFFLRRLRKFGTSPRILRSFYTCTVESILTGCITAWFGNSTAGNRRALQRVVRTARHIVGGELPSLQDIYTRRCTRKARRIIKDSSHPSHRLLSLLPSGRRFRSIRSRTSRLRDSFFPQAIRLMNSHK